MRRHYDSSAIGPLPLQMDEGELSKIVEKIRKGTSSKEEEDAVILAHLRLAIARAMTIGYRFHIHDLDEIVGEAIFVVTESVRKFGAVGNDEGITQYISVTIKHRLKDLVEKTSTVHMSGRTIRSHLKGGLNNSKALDPELQRLAFEGEISKENVKIISKLPVPYQRSFLEKGKVMKSEELNAEVTSALFELLPIPRVLPILEAYADNREEDSEWFKASDNYAVPVAKPVISPEFIEALKNSIQSPIQEYIIGLRAEGYNYTEIAKKVGLCKSKVGNLVTEVESRFNRAYFNETKT